MPTTLRRLLLLAVAGAVVAWILVGRGRTVSAPPTTPTWPPFEPVATPTVEPTATPPVEPPAPPVATPWIEPTDGQCPMDHPLKANDKSGIYHSPGGRFYDRTRAERCYARAEDAEADGYRAAKA